MLLLQIPSEEIELLIEEQRELLRTGQYSKEVCHNKMQYLKKQFNIIKRKELKQIRKYMKNKKNISKIVIEPLISKQTYECAICFEIPHISKILKTNCGHYFCRDCYNKWSNTCTNSKQFLKTTCPCCRKVNPSSSLFVIKE